MNPAGAYLAAGALALAVSLTGAGATAGQWDESYFPNVPLVTQDGETVRFYDDLIDGRIVVVTFIYTECPDLCGLATARLAQIVDWLGDRVGRDVFVYSISLDPETDTPERLREFARAFDAGPGWTFLTGTRENVDLVRHKLGERSESLAEHRSDMVIGNGATGQWRRTSLMSSLVVATTDILELDPAWSPSRPAAPRSGEMQITGTPGESLFLTACAACHTIGQGVRHGPDLAGVALRRDRDWLETFLADPDRMLETGDPVAVALDAAYPAIRMPDLGLAATDVADLLHYIESRTARLGDALPDDASYPDEDGGPGDEAMNEGGPEHTGDEEAPAHGTEASDAGPPAPEAQEPGPLDHARYRAEGT